jgi:3-oxoacyl-[acyl-carrier protein] reductase
VARAFSRAGNTLILHCFSNTGGAAALAAHAQARGAAAHVVQQDLTREPGYDALIGQVRQHTERLDVLVNAGWPFPLRSALGCREGSWMAIDAIFTAATFSVAKMTAVALPLLERGVAPAVVNVGALTGWAPRGMETDNVACGGGVWAAAKAALDALTKYHARELAPAIRVNCVVPGMMHVPHRGVVYPPDCYRRIADLALIKRLVTPDEVADAIRFLADHTFTTGQSLHVNGGLWMP